MTEKNKKEYQEIVLDLLKGTKDQSELKNLYSKDSEYNNELKNKETIEKLKYCIDNIYFMFHNNLYEAAERTKKKRIFFE